MKKLLWVLSLLVFFGSSVSISAFAASGKAIVPPFDARNYNNGAYNVTAFFITNITSSPITVKLNIYNEAGTIVTSGISALSSAQTTGFTVNPGDASASFTLAANATAHIEYKTSTLDRGYATISWNQDGGTSQYGLIADVREGITVNNGNTYGVRTIAVNNNMPF